MDNVIFEFEAKEAELSDIEKITEEVDAKLESLDCPFKFQTQIDIAIDEIYSNIVNHAYKNKKGYAKITLSKIDNGISLAFFDNGVMFNPLESIDDPDITLSAEERKIGGLGIFMVKKSMDKLDYKYQDSQNIFTIQKNF